MSTTLIMDKTRGKLLAEAKELDIIGCDEMTILQLHLNVGAMRFFQRREAEQQPDLMSHYTPQSSPEVVTPERCPHGNKYTYYCKGCGGDGICEHGRERFQSKRGFRILQA